MTPVRIGVLGCGYWGPRVRLFAPLEITRVILRRG